MGKNKPDNKQLRELGTHESAITDRHEGRRTARPAVIEPGRSPGRVPDPNDGR